jgi:hypothetical protein
MYVVHLFPPLGEIMLWLFGWNKMRPVMRIRDLHVFDAHTSLRVVEASKIVWFFALVNIADLGGRIVERVVWYCLAFHACPSFGATNWKTPGFPLSGSAMSMIPPWCAKFPELTAG